MSVTRHTCTSSSRTQKSFQHDSDDRWSQWFCIEVGERTRLLWRSPCWNELSQPPWASLWQEISSKVMNMWSPIFGDAALTNGISFEALNNIGHSTKKFIGILNDNEWSIAKNVGAIASYLNKLITHPSYNRLQRDFQKLLKRLPKGELALKLGHKAEEVLKGTVSNLVLEESSSKGEVDGRGGFGSSLIFEEMGLRYLGPIDGHNLPMLIAALEYAKTCDQPVVLHVMTQGQNMMQPSSTLKNSTGWGLTMSKPERQSRGRHRRPRGRMSSARLWSSFAVKTALLWVSQQPCHPGQGSSTSSRRSPNAILTSASLKSTQ